MAEPNPSESVGPAQFPDEGRGTGAAAEQTRPGPSRRMPGRRWLLGAGLAQLALIAGAGLFMALSPGDEPGDVPQSVERADPGLIIGHAARPGFEAGAGSALTPPGLTPPGLTPPGLSPPGLTPPAFSSPGFALPGGMTGNPALRAAAPASAEPPLTGPVPAPAAGGFLPSLVLPSGPAATDQARSGSGLTLREPGLQPPIPSVPMPAPAVPAFAPPSATTPSYSPLPSTPPILLVPEAPRPGSGIAPAATNSGLVAPPEGLAAPPAAPAAETARLTVLLVNDLDRMEAGPDGRGGMAKLAGAIRDERDRLARPASEREGGNGALRAFLAVHAGDMLSPSLYSGFDRGEHMVRLLNESGIDLFVPGNHEFDFGPEVAAQRLGALNMPVLAANLRTAAGAFGPALPRKMVTLGGLRLGFVGVITEDTQAISRPGPDVTFLPVLETVRQEASLLRAEGADFVIAIAHTSLKDDLALVRSGLVDLVLSGHDHVEMAYWDGRTGLMEAGAQGERLLVADLDLVRRPGPGGQGIVRSLRPSFRWIDTEAVTPSLRVAAMVAEQATLLSKRLDEPLATLDVLLDSRRAVVRGEEAAIGNLVADAIRAASGADVALINGGGIRGDRVYEPGTTLTGRHLAAELPFGNRAVLLRVTGAQLIAALENGLSQIEQRAGRFPQISGLTLTYDPARPPGRRVLALEVAGAPLRSDGQYTLATSDFLAGGGDGYAMLRQGEVLIDATAGELLVQQVIDQLRAMGRLAPRTEGRLRRVEG